MSVYSRFTDDEKLLYFGRSMGSGVTLQDPTIWTGGTRSIGLPSVALTPGKRGSELGRSRVPLNANLAAIPDLFNVMSITLPASNVTKLTKKQRYTS